MPPRSRRPMVVAEERFGQHDQPRADAGDLIDPPIRVRDVGVSNMVEAACTTATPTVVRCHDTDRARANGAKRSVVNDIAR